MLICSKAAPNVGLEPTTVGLRVQRSTDWASRAEWDLLDRFLYSPIHISPSADLFSLKVMPSMHIECDYTFCTNTINHNKRITHLGLFAFLRPYDLVVEKIVRLKMSKVLNWTYQCYLLCKRNLHICYIWCVCITTYVTFNILNYVSLS